MFQALIDDLTSSGALISEQRPFSDLQGQSRPTPSYISVDELESLSSELRKASFMVFRLGRSRESGRGTEFALAKSLREWNDYFLLDEVIFQGLEAKPFELRSGDRTLELFQMLPQLTESSMVNLGLGSGLIQAALGIEKLAHASIPATGRCTPSFSFRPNVEIPNVLSHNSGQVEIDSLFMGEREGETCLFVLEAKNSRKLRSLAKHKLYYPFRALIDLVPYKVIPVYLRTVRSGDGVDFYIAECSVGDDASRLSSALSDLSPVAVSRTRMPDIYSS